MKITDGYKLFRLASMTPLCALFGSLLISIPMQLFGRRISLMGIAVPFFLGFHIMGFTYFGRHKAQLYIGRIMTGLMNGAATPAAQIYVIYIIFTHVCVLQSENCRSNIM